MINLIDFFRKEKPKNIIYDPCCNNCEYGQREYSMFDEISPTGIRCEFGIENNREFDYLCDLYKKDKLFIAYNKSLESSM